MTQEKRFKSRFRTGCLFVLLFLLLLALGLGTSVLYFYNRPINTQSVNDRVLRRLERISGMSVAFDTANLLLPQRRYHITNLRFIDPSRPETPVLKVEDVYATIDPWELVTDPESTISHVVLKNPSGLEIIYSQNSLKLGARSQFLVDAILKAQPPDAEVDGKLPFEHLKMENVEVSFTESAGILPDDEPQSAAMRLHGDMDIKNEGLNTLSIAFEGSAVQAPEAEDVPTSSSTATGVKASLTLRPDDSVELDGSIQQVALNGIFRDNREGWLHANDVTFDFMTSQTAGNRAIAGWANLGSIKIHDPAKNFNLDDEQLQLTTAIDINTSDGTTKLERLTLNSAGASLSMAGSGKFSKPAPSYQVAVTGNRLDEDYRAIMERFLPEGWDIKSETEQLAFDLNLSSHAGKLEQLAGHLQLRGVEVKTPEVPVALKNVFGDLEFSENGVTIKDITADYAGARIALDGAFTGDLWGARTGSLALNWSAIVDLARILDLHARQLPGGNEVSAAGRVSGNGTWNQDIRWNAGEKSGVPQIEGGFQFENVSFSDPLLPGAITELNGTAVVDDDKLSVRNLTGKMRGNEMEVEGLIQGDKFFWKDPQVSASLTSRLDLSHLEDYLPADRRQQADAYNLSGTAETRMIVSGPIADLGSNFTGVMNLDNVGFSPNLQFMEGNITGVSGTVMWNGSELTLNNLTGQVNGQGVAFNGSVASTKVDIRVKTEAPLDAVQQTFPRLGQFLQMSGGLSTDLRFTVGNDTPAPAASLNQMLEQARALLDDAVKNQSFSLNGELQLKGASIRHIAMPPARREAGRNIPVGRVTGMTGTVQVRNDTLRVPGDSPLSCAFADTENCRLSGQIQLRPGNFPAMQVNISTRGTLHLDTWIAGWGKELPRPDRPPITGKTFDLDADIQANQLMLRGQRAGRSRGKLSFKLVQDESPRVTQFHEVVVQGAQPGMGHIIGSGRIDSFVWNPQQFPRWGSTVEVQSMPLETMLAAIFVQPTNIRGMTSGRLQVEGKGADVHSIRGDGSFRMRNLEIGGTAVIRQLGQTTGRNFGGMLFETAQAATFQIGNGALSSRDLALQTNGLQLDMQGDYWFADNPARGIQAKTIDGNLRLRLFKSVFGNIPIIGQVADLADEVTNAFLLAFRVTGTADNPQVTPVALPVLQGGP